LAIIALFCKFWTVSQPVQFANVCNVRGLPKLTRRAEAGGQKLIFSCTNLQSMSQYYHSVFPILNQVNSVYLGLLALHTTVSAFETCGFSAQRSCPPPTKFKDCLVLK